MSPAGAGARCHSTPVPQLRTEPVEEPRKLRLVSDGTMTDDRPAGVRSLPFEVLARALGIDRAMPSLPAEAQRDVIQLALRNAEGYRFHAL
jgi:hypothetical protein